MIGGLMTYFPLTGGFYLGWSLGANDAANIFGTAIASRIVTFKKAVLISSVFIIIGALVQGYQGIETVSLITSQTLSTAVIITVSAAITVTIMTYFSLPVSASQSLVGAVVGIGLATGDVNFDPLFKIVVSWIFTPIGSMVAAILFYRLTGFVIDHIPMSILTRDKLLWSGLLLVGIYGSYALGANNVTVATGVFSGLLPGVTNFYLALVGSVAIALGVMTFSKRVILEVGSKIIPHNAFTAFVTVLSMSVTVHIFAFIGAPVSTSQGIIGAILGVSLMRGINPISNKEYKRIAWGWILTPVVSMIFASSAFAIFT